MLRTGARLCTSPVRLFHYTVHAMTPGRMIPERAHPAMRWCLAVRIVACCAAVFAVSPAAAMQLEGRVIRVVNGDKLVVLDANNTQHRVRLATVDVPNSGQRYAEQATANLVRLVMNRNVKVEWTRKNRNGYLVGKVLLDGKDVGFLQISSGFAWHYRMFSHWQSSDDRQAYSAAQAMAAALGAGLWSDFSPTPPWEFREKQQAAQKSAK